MKTNNVLYGIFLVVLVIAYIYFCKVIVDSAKKRTALLEGQIKEENEFLRLKVNQEYKILSDQHNKLVNFVNEMGIDVRSLRSKNKRNNDPAEVQKSASVKDTTKIDKRKAKLKKSVKAKK